MSLSPALRAAGRLANLVLALLVVETLTGGIHDAIAADALARAARLAALAIALAIPALIWTRLLAHRWPRADAGLARHLARLVAPWRALRLGVLYAAATAVCTVTVAADYDLRWRAGAVFAVAALAVGVALELGVAAWRAAPAPSPALARLGGLVWLAPLYALAFVVLPRIQGTGAALVACLVALAVVAPLSPPSRRAALGALAAVGLLAFAGMAVEVTRPGLRRLATADTPMSRLGLALLLHVTDLDRDGSSGLLGLDCDDLDPDRYPSADDLPDDGVDQNCTGADASRAAADARWAPGGPRAAPPPRQPPPRRPDVVVISVDALRADMVTAERMPETAAWAAGGWRFSTARTSATFTDAALMALMAGVEPRHVRDGGRVAVAAGRPPTLAWALATAGWHTMAILPLTPPRPFLFAGITDALSPARRRGERPAAAEILGVARKLLAAAPAGRPRFLWVHLMDTHAPYLGGTSFDDYLRAAAALDIELAAFLRELPAEAIVVLTADHGEAFGEHGFWTHQHTLFDEEVRVPLVLRVPAHLGGGGRVIDTPVGQVDVMPTLLELCGVSAPYPRHGESLLAHVLDGAPLADPVQLFEIWLPHRHQQGLADGCLKWVRDLDLEYEALYDTCADPGERHDVRAARGEDARRLRAELFMRLDLELDAFRSWR